MNIKVDRVNKKIKHEIRQKHLLLLLKYIKADARKFTAKIPSANIQNEPFLLKDFFYLILDIFIFSFEVVSYVIVPIAIKPTRGMKIHLHSFCSTTVWKVSPMRVCRVLVLLYFP